MKLYVSLKVTFVCFLVFILVVQLHLPQLMNEPDNTGADLADTPAELLVAKEYHSHIQIGPSNQER